MECVCEPIPAVGLREPALLGINPGGEPPRLHPGQESIVCHNWGRGGSGGGWGGRNWKGGGGEGQGPNKAEKSKTRVRRVGEDAGVHRLR